MHRNTSLVFRFLLSLGFIIAVLFLILVVSRIFYRINLDKINAVVEKIHATKLTMADILGTNIPPDPGALADQTIVGVDANVNGIRDDVELAIFKQYPNSAKTRAVLLQYALALQMEFTQTVINKETVIAVAQEESRSYSCVDKVSSEEGANMSRSFVKKIQVNTKERDQAEIHFYESLSSYNSLDVTCDIDYSKLPN
jgi:hypothetical protein